MPPPTVDQLIADYRRERRARRLWMLACRLTALGLLALYLYVGIVLGRSDVFYVTISLAGLVTGLSSFVVIFYFEIPQLVRNLHGDDPQLADASWSAIDRLRGELLPPLFEVLWVMPGQYEALLRELDRPKLAAMTAARGRDPWRRWGRIYLVVFLLALAAFLALIALYDPRPPGSY